MTQQAKALATKSNVQNPHSGRSKLIPQSCLWPPHTCHSMEPPKHKHIHIIHTHTHHSHTNNSKQIKILKQEIVAMNSSWEETFKTSSVHISSFRYSTPHALNKLFYRVLNSDNHWHSFENYGFFQVAESQGTILCYSCWHSNTLNIWVGDQKF